MIPHNRIAQRLLGLRRAIEARDWDAVLFHFNNVVRGVGRLVAPGELSRSVDEELWEPLERAGQVAHTPEQLAALAERGASPGDFQGAELWKNGLYTVVVTRWDNGDVQELSIRRNDRQPVHDWRHFQMIKTQIAGPEFEAVEIYPAESRLMDTANQYYLFVLPRGERMPMGYMGPRLLVDADEQGDIGSVQRALPEGWISTFHEVYATVRTPEEVQQ